MAVLSSKVMQTRQKIIVGSAVQMPEVEEDSVHLVVTSPPYPMIAMWDEIFSRQDSDIASALSKGRAMAAFEGMHRLLDMVWRQLARVVVPGGWVCINIGDATRTIDGTFGLYPNHSRIQNAMMQLGFTGLPAVLWRKPTNAPNKFMGSGMLPAGAYVTLEHEYILIFRKGGKRVFSTNAEKERRRESAIFWEERNLWYSDVWFDLLGTTQKLEGSADRRRSGAFPLELPLRLILMHSLIGDTVLDPFVGTGTTLLAAAACGRNGIGCELDPELARQIPDHLNQGWSHACERMAQRIRQHREFVRQRLADGKTIQHCHLHYGCPVITNQERQMRLWQPQTLRWLEMDSAEVDYGENADDIARAFEGESVRTNTASVGRPQAARRQRTLFS